MSFDAHDFHVEVGFFGTKTSTNAVLPSDSAIDLASRDLKTMVYIGVGSSMFGCQVSSI
jgi:hypothetical protein